MQCTDVALLLGNLLAGLLQAFRHDVVLRIEVVGDSIIQFAFNFSYRLSQPDSR